MWGERGTERKSQSFLREGPAPTPSGEAQDPFSTLSRPLGCAQRASAVVFWTEGSLLLSSLGRGQILCVCECTRV